MAKIIRNISIILDDNGILWVIDEEGSYIRCFGDTSEYAGFHFESRKDLVTSLMEGGWIDEFPSFETVEPSDIEKLLYYCHRHAKPEKLDICCPNHTCTYTPTGE